MTKLTLIGRVATPAAMVVFMTYEISRSMNVAGWWLIAIIVGAALTAVGIEVVGILAGHALDGYWRAGDRWRSILAFGLLLIYTIGAIYILRGNATIAPVPIVAAIVYLVAPLVESLERKEGTDTAVSSTRLKFELEQEARDREIERRIKLEKQQAANAAKLAKIKQPARYQQRDARQFTGNLPSDWRQLTDHQRHDLAHRTREERDKIMPEMADRTRRLWHERLDEIAAQNGSFMEMAA